MNNVVYSDCIYPAFKLYKTRNILFQRGRSDSFSLTIIIDNTYILNLHSPKDEKYLTFKCTIEFYNITRLSIDIFNDSFYSQISLP